MGTASLNEILAKIDQRLETLSLIDTNTPPVSLDPLSEIGLYITNDRLLGELYRQYLDAQQNYIKVIQQHGNESAMAEVAKDMSESSFCAMETRLIELRHEKELSERVEKVQKKQRAEYIKDMQARQAAYARRGITQPQALDRAKNEKYISNTKKTHTTENLMIWALLAVSMSEMHMPEQPHIAKMSFSKAAA